MPAWRVATDGKSLSRFPYSCATGRMWRLCATRTPLPHRATFCPAMHPRTSRTWPGMPAGWPEELVGPTAYSPIMRNSKALIGLLAAGLITAGCGSDGSSSGSGEGKAQKALPVIVDGPQKDVRKRGDDNIKVTPAPERGAPLTEQVEHRLREAVLLDVKVPGETSATCPGGVTQKAGAVTPCTVTYEGAAIPYEVKISDSYTKGSMITSYTTTPKKGVLVAKVMYDLLYETYGAESGRDYASKLSCEELPAAKVVEWESDTGYTCQYWNKHANGGDGGYRTLRIKTGPSGYNTPGFEEVEAD